MKNIIQNIIEKFAIVKNQKIVSFSKLMDIEVKIEDVEIDKIKFKKMIFLFNALENGWSIKKKKDSYIFTKTHEGKKEIFDESYLAIFMKENANINNILS
jgi:hypothetical protein